MGNLEMKVGIKTYTDIEGVKYIKDIAKYCDFIEILVMPDNDLYKEFKHIGAPITIHAAHGLFGCDPGDESKQAKTKRCIKKAIEAADYLDARHIVVHPGHLIDEKSRERSISLLTEFNEPRFRIENLPDITGLNSFKPKKDLCAMPDEMKEFITRLRCSLCLDFSHARFAAHVQNKPLDEVIAGFMALKPKYFHICGGSIGKKYDHRSLKESDLDLREWKKLLPKDAYVALETPHVLETQKEELEFLRA